MNLRRKSENCENHSILLDIIQSCPYRGYLGAARYPLQMKEQYHGAYAEYRRDTPGTKAAGYKDRKVLPEGFWQIFYIFK